MNIAWIVPGFSAHADDWAIPALQTLATTLAQSNNITVFSQRYPAKGAYTFDDLTHFALGAGERRGAYSPWVWVKTAQAIEAQHKKTPFDVLHAFWADEAGLSAVLAGAMIKRPVVVSLGGWELTALPDIAYGAQLFWAKRQVLRYVLKQATIVTVGSYYQYDLCLQYNVPESKLTFAPLGVDIDRFTPAIFDPDTLQTPIIVQAASLIPVKDQQLLLDTVQRVKEKLPSITLHLIGSGPLQADLVDYAKTRNIADRILWKNQIAYLDMARHFQQGHVYLQSSRHESQGMSVLEAMACGLPVLGTPVGVLKDEACLSATWSKEKLADQVLEIFSDEAQYQKFRAKALRTIAMKYSLSVSAQRFQALYEAVGAKR